MTDGAPAPVVDGFPAGWARAIQDPAAFTAEQARFAQVWTFLGLASDLASEGDWIRASIGLRSVFVQRIRGELKGFENRCAHRFYPLRVEDRGNGPIVCGLHHWRYDDEGRAVGIPVCQQAFGVVSRALGAALAPIDVAVCGSLVFGRFPGPHATQSLEAFLGDCHPVLAALTRHVGRPATFSRAVEAHWKLCMQISVDDYHLAAVHPSTFGKGGRYLDRENMNYVRVGAHSIFQGGNGDFDALVASLRAGTARPGRYIVLQMMPGLILAHAAVFDGYHVCVLTHYGADSHRRSLQRTWLFSSPLGRGQARTPRLFWPLQEKVLRPIALHYTRRILDEDALAVERQQTNAAGFTDAALIGRLEERVAWYEAAYRDIMQGKPDDRPDGSATT